ncbi:MAG: hypothetical protein ACXW4G_09610, partial [Candidatus Deferrimicrobiaceae bacterium]
QEKEKDRATKAHPQARAHPVSKISHRFPPSYCRYEPVIAGYPGETIAPKTLAVPRRQGKSVVASLPIVLYIRERFPCNGRATTEMEKAKRKTMGCKLDGGRKSLNSQTYYRPGMAILRDGWPAQQTSVSCGMPCFRADKTG